MPDSPDCHVHNDRSVFDALQHSPSARRESLMLIPEAHDVDCHHCWHLDFNAAVLDMAPPIYGIQCCHCGAREGMTDAEREAVAPQSAPHGPHRPSASPHA
jgi:hypothetical protein